MARSVAPRGHGIRPKGEASRFSPAIPTKNLVDQVTVRIDPRDTVAGFDVL
jgi:hypothetical protein